MIRSLPRPYAPTSPSRSSPLWLLPLALAAGAEPAWAAPAEPSCELDCPQGTTCELAPGECPAIGCADPADCPPCNPDPTPYCAPADCDSDADCGVSMRCAERTVLDCPGAEAAPAIAPSAGSSEPERVNAPAPPECTSDIIRQCTPRWQLPCTVDADCGAGFRCEETEVCGAPPYDPSAREPGAAAPKLEATCRPSGTFACVVVETPCNTDADCAADFICADNPNGTCSSSSDGQTQCEPADPARLCTPRIVASPAGAGGDVTSAEGTVPAALASDAANQEPSANQGGCALNGPAAPNGLLALLSTLGLGALFARRRRATWQ